MIILRGVTRAMLARAVVGPQLGVLRIPDRLLHVHDETVGDELEREIRAAASGPVAGEDPP